MSLSTGRQAVPAYLVNLIMKNRRTAVMTELGEDEMNLRKTGNACGQDVVTGCA